MTCIFKHICIMCARICVFCNQRSGYPNYYLCNVHYKCIDCINKFALGLGYCSICKGDDNTYLCVGCNKLRFPLASYCNFESHKFCRDCEVGRDSCGQCQLCTRCNKKLPLQFVECGHYLCEMCAGRHNNCPDCEHEANRAICSNCGNETTKQHLFGCGLHNICRECSRNNIFCKACANICDCCGTTYNQISKLKCQHERCVNCIKTNGSLVEMHTLRKL